MNAWQLLDQYQDIPTPRHQSEVRETLANNWQYFYTDV